jgi:hypothetical protein
VIRVSLKEIRVIRVSLKEIRVIRVPLKTADPRGPASRLKESA